MNIQLVRGANSRATDTSQQRTLREKSLSYRPFHLQRRQSPSPLSGAQKATWSTAGRQEGHRPRHRPIGRATHKQRLLQPDPARWVLPPTVRHKGVVCKGQDSARRAGKGSRAPSINVTGVPGAGHISARSSTVTAANPEFLFLT